MIQANVAGSFTQKKIKEQQLLEMMKSKLGELHATHAMFDVFYATY